MSCKVKLGRSRSSPVVDKVYHVLDVYDKSYNKWWMLGDEKTWSVTMKAEYKKRFKLSICMI